MPMPFSGLAITRSFAVLFFTLILSACGGGGGGGDPAPVDPGPGGGAAPDTTAPITTLLSAPQTITQETNATFTFEANESGATFEANIDGAGFAAETSPISLTGLALGTHSVQIRARDAAGNQEDPGLTHQWEIVAPSSDTTPPETTLTSGPSGTTNQTTATFAFTSDDPAAVFEGSLNGAAFLAITSPHQLNGLADGAHTFRIRAIDPSGNFDATPVEIQWNVDATPPTTTITAAPSGTDSRTTGTISFSANDANATFEGSLDGGAFQAVTSPHQLSGLSEGSHTFRIRATDALGNVENPPVSVTWTVAAAATPTASIVFPTPVSMTDAAQITVVGTATNTSTITGIRVNGQAATSSDGFANWRASVNLTPGNNTLTVSIERSGGAAIANAATVTVKYSPNLLTQADGVAVDGAGQRAFVVDDTRIIEVNLATGSRSILADASTGSGPVFQRPRGIAYDAASNRVLVVDQTARAVIAINTQTRARQVLSDDSTPSAVDFAAPRGAAIDSTGNRLLVVDAGAAVRGLLEVDLTSGAREIISINSPTTGSNFTLPAYVALDAANNRALITDLVANDIVIAVDLATGVQSILSGPGVGSGEDFSVAGNIAVDPTTNRALVSDPGVNAVVAVSLSNGNRSRFSDNSDAGPRLFEPRGVAYDATSSRLLLAEGQIKSVLAISTTAGTGDRSRVSDDAVGSGSGLGFVQDLGIDSANDRLVLLQEDPFELTALSLGTSNRNSLVSNASGSGPAMASASRLAVTSSGSEAYVIAQNANQPTSQAPALFRVNLATGQRSALVANLSALGTSYQSITSGGVVLNGADQALFVGGFGNVVDPGPPPITETIDSLVSAQLASGQLAEVSGVNRGTGPLIGGDNIMDLAISAAAGVVFASDIGENRLLAIALGSGNRTVLSGAGTGTGPDFGSIGSVGVNVTQQSAYVVDLGERAVLSIPLAGANAGNRALVSGAARGTGPALGPFVGLDVDATDGVIYGFDLGWSGIIAIEPVSGDRIIVSR